MYIDIANMYEVNNLNEIITLKDQLNESKMKKRETIQPYIMSISLFRDKL